MLAPNQGTQNQMRKGSHAVFHVFTAPVSRGRALGAQNGRRLLLQQSRKMLLREAYFLTRPEAEFWRAADRISTHLTILLMTIFARAP